MGDLVERTKAGYAAFNARDVETLSGMLTPDFEWHEAAEIPGPKSAVTRDEFVKFMRGFAVLWDEFRLEPLELIESDGKLYAKVRLVGRGKASEEQVDFVVHHVWQFRGELYARMNAYLDEAEAKAAAGIAP